MDDETFIRSWIARERERGLVDIKLFPHTMTTAEGIAAMATVLRDVDAGLVVHADLAGF